MCFLGKRFGRESFLAGKTNFVQENISYGKSDKISKKDSKFFPNEFFLDEVISFFSLTFSLSLSLSLSVPLFFSLALQIKHKYSCQILKHVHVKLLQMDRQWEKSIWDPFQNLHPR